MRIRPFRSEDASELAALSASCARGEADFVLNPMWSSEEELHAEFARHGIDPSTHLLVADAEEEGAAGMVGFLRSPGAPQAGLFCPIVRKRDRGRGLGGDLLRAALALGVDELGIRLATAAVGTRNRGGYSLLTALGFRAVRQVYVMRCAERPASTPALIDGLVAEEACEQDADALLEIYTSCDFPVRTPEQMRACLCDGRHDHVVARSPTGEVAAFVELETHWPRRPWVSFVGVRKSLRDRGLGSGLVGFALERHFDRKAQAALLTLSPGNRTAVRAYEKVGFRRYRLLDVLQKDL